MPSLKVTRQGVTTTTFIYALLDPTTHKVRYIGKSDEPHYRLRFHLWASKRERSYRSHWIRTVILQGLQPIVEIIDEVSKKEWQAAEAAYIMFYKEEGCDLVNDTPGGDGCGAGMDHPSFGRPVSEEHRAKISAAKKGKSFTPEHRAALSKAQKGKTRSHEHRAAVSLALKKRIRKPHTWATRFKISASLRSGKNGMQGRKHTAETISKMRASAQKRASLQRQIRVVSKDQLMLF